MLLCSFYAEIIFIRNHFLCDKVIMQGSIKFPKFCPSQSFIMYMGSKLVQIFNSKGVEWCTKVPQKSNPYASSLLPFMICMSGMS